MANETDNIISVATISNEEARNYNKVKAKRVRTEYHREYYRNVTTNKPLVKCEACDIFLMKRSLKYHLKSKKHLNNLEKCNRCD